MKSTPILTGLLALLPILRLIADEPAPAPATGPESPPESVVPEPARTVGEIPDGTPPPPATPKPRLMIGPEDVLASKSIEQGEREITVQKVAPIELPTIPLPSAPPTPDSAEVQARIEAMRESHPGTRFAFVGATVFRSSKLSGGVRTSVQIWDPGTRKAYSCVTASDWSVLAGVGSLELADGSTLGLIMSQGAVDLDRWEQLAAARGHAYQPPEFPEFQPEKDYAVTAGEPTQEALASFRSIEAMLHDPEQAARLKAAYEGREAARLEKEAALRANPEKPKNLVIRHWRLDTAGLAGETPKPAITR